MRLSKFILHSFGILLVVCSLLLIVLPLKTRSQSEPAAVVNDGALMFNVHHGSVVVLPTPTPTPTPTLPPTPTPTPTATPATYNALVLAYSPVLYYPMADAASTAVDSVAARNGTYGSGTVRYAGIVNHNGSPAYAHSFPGSSNSAATAVLVGPSATAIQVYPITIDFWVMPIQNLVTNNGTALVFAVYGTPGAGNWVLYTHDSGSLAFGISAGGSYTELNSGFIMQPNTIYHITAEYDGANQYLCINCTTAWSYTAVNATGPITYSGGLTIAGDAPTSTAYSVLGVISNFAIFGQALPLTAVAQFYNQGSGVTPPTPSPSPTASGAPVLANGVEWPTSFTPFNATGSVWTTKLSANPTIASYSTTVINYQFGSGNTFPLRSQEAGPSDYAYSVFYCDAANNASCVTVTLTCVPSSSTYCTPSLPATIRVPPQMRPPCHGCSGDQISGIIQPDNSEIDIAYYNMPSGNWGTAGNTTIVGSAGYCPNWITGNGFYSNVVPSNQTGATAGGNCITAGIMRANELASGTINHALKLIPQCAGNGTQYPVGPSMATALCGNPTYGPPLGALLWYDCPPGSTANGCIVPTTNPERAIMGALHDYGGYFLDNINGATGVTGLWIIQESGEMFYDFGTTNPWSTLGWTGNPIPGAWGGLRYTYEDIWNPTGFTATYWKQHFHWLAPCAAQHTC
jgi:hypothetical protein